MAGELIDALRQAGFLPNHFCHCGCGRQTGNYFASGDDSQFAPNLLGTLQDNPNISLVEAVQRLRDQSSGDAGS